MSKVVLISPPYMKISYPTYNIPSALAKGCNYMNPGLLICASVLDEHNISNRIIKISDLNDGAITSCIDKNTKLVGISCTCAWEYLESLQIAKILKKKYSNIKIVMSGWQIKSIKEQVFSDSDFVDYIITGDAEYTIYELFKNIDENKDYKIPTVINKDDISNKMGTKFYPNVNFKVIDFKKFPNYKNYIPYVEESRNCPFSCKFCLNSCVNDKYQNVPFNIFVKNVELLEQAYGSKTSANLLAANFGVNKIETKKKLEFLKTKNINWNIELHVDNPWEYYINDLISAGINKVSIGFESGSPRILNLMNKTHNSFIYLSRLEKMLNELNKKGIKPSLNLLIDYHETIETLTETLDFLEKNREMIKKVKANFMFAFEGILEKIDYTYNPNIIIDDYGKSIHAYPILPNNVSLEDMSYIIEEIEKSNYNKKILLSTGFNLKRK